MGEENSRTWEDHWAESHIPWDAGTSSPGLEHYLADHPVTPGGRALVPGCGSGYDVFRLARAGLSAMGIDVAPSAAARFAEVRNEWQLEEDRAKLIVADFFTLTSEDLGGSCDLIWDYTFYCAISPDQRDAWRDQVAALLAPKGTLVMLLFPVVPGAALDQGPPYPLDPEAVTRQLAPRFERMKLERPRGSHPGREGKEWLSVWKKR